MLFSVFFFANLNKDAAFIRTALWADVDCFSFLETLIKLDAREGIIKFLEVKQDYFANKYLQNALNKWVSGLLYALSSSFIKRNKTLL